MLVRRFTLICLIAMVIGIGLSALVRETRDDRAWRSGATMACPASLHPSCGRSVL